MTTASLPLCRELYELSGWKPKSDEMPVSWWENRTPSTGIIIPDGCIPAYDLGFLLRKLPRKLNGVNSKQRDGNFNLYASRGKTAWVASYADADGSIIRRLKEGAESQNNRNFWFIHGSADTPEDAACKLLCELIRQKVLTP